MVRHLRIHMVRNQRETRFLVDWPKTPFRAVFGSFLFAFSMRVTHCTQFRIQNF